TGWYDPTLGQIINPVPGPNSALLAPMPGPFIVSASLPAQVLHLSVDLEGRLLVGTEEGLYRVNVHAIGYDYTSENNGILSAPWEPSPAAIAAGLPSPPADFPRTPAAVVTTLNGNLQIADLTSVAVDPVDPTIFYSSSYGTGLERTSISGGLLAWQTMAL